MATVIDVNLLPRICAATVALVLATTIAGCSSPTTTPTPTPTPDPTFTEEEAFALAEETFREYLAEIETLDYTDISDIDRLARFSTKSYFAGERKSVVNGILDGQSIVGSTELLWFRPYETIDNTTVIALICEDISNAHIVDSDGKKLTPDDRPDLSARRITFKQDGDMFIIAAAEAVRTKEC
ncbi:hypothetical protein [Microbacterium sp. YY-01]|uniref:hypothetical protein n=1 Tax=Microbacterium sp. YY-01 TaxID=3421634 RepID=UPI003D1818D1